MFTDFSLKNAIKLRNTDPETVSAIQVELLKEHIRQAAKAPYYRNLLDSTGCNPDDFSSLADLRAIPLTDRHDLEQNPADFHAISPALMADLALTSGTTGDSVMIPYSANDLKRLAFNETIGFWGTGIRPGDRILLCVTIDRCFIAGLAYYSGLVELGATAIRSGPGQPARQWDLIQKLQPDGMVGVPSFLLRIASWARENGIDPGKSGIRSIVTIGEPVRKADHSLTALGRDLESAWGGRIFSSYGATEMETAFCECQAFQGSHIHPELMLVEIIDDQGNLVPAGHPGEVVVTPMGVEGLPLLRFRTGDIARLHTAPCSCGWQTPRLGAIEGRLAQRLKVKGTTLYPEMIFQALQEIPGVEASYIEVRSSYDLADEITVIVGADEPIDKVTINEFLQARLRVRPDVIIRKKADVLNVMEKAGGHKLKKFFDLR
ncbi:MAG: AMP-binding protein [Proteobacteria bacterium]|nr:AMP-binding protein [Pseudomonadota bacterium]MBU1710656.1 AMP-binding protein [Pseudomonadota bacterium]